jgi:hypothetical protein
MTARRGWRAWLAAALEPEAPYCPRCTLLSQDHLTALLLLVYLMV